MLLIGCVNIAGLCRARPHASARNRDPACARRRRAAIVRQLLPKASYSRRPAGSPVPPWASRLPAVRDRAAGCLRGNAGQVGLYRPRPRDHGGRGARHKPRVRPAPGDPGEPGEPPRDARRSGEPLDRRHGAQLAAARTGRRGGRARRRAAGRRGIAGPDARRSHESAPRIRRQPCDDRDAVASGRPLSVGGVRESLFDQTLASMRAVDGVEQAAAALTLPYERASTPADAGPARRPAKIAFRS